MQKSTKGFTLVELLVVVAIIALLLAILLPALGKARKLAKAVVCMSNQRECGVGLLYYAQENRQVLAVGRRKADGNFRLWPHFHVNGFGIFDQPNQDPVLNTDVALCPATATYSTAKEGGWGATNGQMGGYGIFWADVQDDCVESGLQQFVDMTGPTGAVRFHYQELERLPFAPASMFWLADSLGHPNFYTTVEPPMNPGFRHDTRYGPYKAGLMHLLHPADQANVLFYDGHAKGVTGDEGAQDFPIEHRKYLDRFNQEVQF